MIWSALMAFARPWQAAPAAHRLVCCVLACVTLSSCAGGAPAPSVRPARASLTRFTTSVTELRQRMEERPSCVLEATKSYDQTWPRYSGLSRMHDPSLSHSRPRFGCLLRDLEPLLSPDPLHPLVVHGPALRPQHPGHHPVPVAPEPASHLHHVLSQRLLIFASLRYPTLRRACLAQHPARPALTHPKPLAYLHHAASAPLGA